MLSALQVDGGQLQALLELTQAVLAGAELSSLMQHTVALATGMLGVEYGAVWELLPDRNALLLRTGDGPDAAVARGALRLEMTTLADHVLRSTNPLVVEDWSHETRFPQPLPARQQGVCSSLYIVISGQERPFGLLGVDSRAPRRFAEDEQQFLQALANVLALAVARAQASQTLEQQVAARTREIEQRRQVTESLPEILRILNSNRALGEILAYIIAQACRLLGTAAGAIYRLDSPEERLHIQASCGLAADDAALPPPLVGSVPGQAIRLRQPVQIADAAFDRPDLRVFGATAAPPDVRLSRRYPAQLAVPLIVKAEVYGAIALYYDHSRTFAAEEIRLAVALSDQAALAIENARLIAGAQDQAILEERQRLARDLHDSVTQSLYSVTLHARAATRLLAANEGAKVAHYLRELQDIAQEALDEMRLLIFELRPTVLDQAGLAAALRARLDAVEERANLETQLTVEGVGALPSPVEQGLYRVAQEVLNNTLKHAHARHVTVQLQQTPAAVVLEITDDGVGFDPTLARETGGLGLRGIAERVAQLGGQLEMQSAPGTGTRLRVEVGL